ncbi:sigma-70 family RNA polymerase sigma factor [Thalassobacillus hwangdonensis]|uniref:Sigma-70 family RNA polymerase sigma factor n=1 Tax=Thalassobacillus hwangdonensis TaxID=546108 RepID=A0ABW3L535_9BACI
MKSNKENFIKRLQSGKEDALDYIVDQYLSLVQVVISKVLSPLNREGIIEECVNDVFLSVWENAKKFKGDRDNFKSWLCSIARYKAIDYYRKTVKNFEITVDQLEKSNEKSLEDEIIQLENKKELLILIRGMKPVDQKIFIMKYFLGYSTDEIAAKLSMTKGSIGNRLYRGKRELSKRIENLNIGGSLI